MKYTTKRGRPRGKRPPGKRWCSRCGDWTNDYANPFCRHHRNEYNRERYARTRNPRPISPETAAQIAIQALDQIRAACETSRLGPHGLSQIAERALTTIHAGPTVEELGQSRLFDWRSAQ